jgi:hypothetical protein
MRVESSRPVRNGGWFHADDPARPSPPPPPPPPRPKPRPDFGALMQRYWRENEADPAALPAEAERLGVSAPSLQWLKAAWAQDRGALAIPMYDATCPDGARPIGIRYRTSDGKKFAATGSSSGIFIPYGIFSESTWVERIYVCEGPTDTAAALTMGCWTIGRASCRGGEEMVLAALRQYSPADTVVVTDNDSPGFQGARELFRKIRGPRKLLTPPAKDLRTFHRNGGTKEVLESLLHDILRQ